ncbi:S8 family serine peptidase [Zafaria sp. Z1313]|uniref:S8 family serine peptidase n=1 Tax=unclassified Zafaria TaxID=2828765 RepID=UPI002E7966B8|nr:S8 family serine peptidase [Zafaria sp. J156]MEE1619839.1 S8 family serine peptidase [Zafaria sp. J156]
MFDPDQPLTDHVTTGRFIVVFASEDTDAPELLGSCGVRDVADSRDFDGPLLESGGPPAGPAGSRSGPSVLGGAAGAGEGSGSVYFAELGIAVVDADPEQLGTLRTRSIEQRRPLSVSPELVHRVLTGPPGGRGRRAAETPPSVDFADTAELTWGLQAVQAVQSGYTGAGIRVAVLDTGFDSAHPDYAGRAVTVQSFIAGEDAQDGHGHGTHCIGSACGPRDPETGPGYGVASGAEIFAGKVLGNAGSGSDAGILAGIDWAVHNGCAVISMSLGADVAQVHPPYVAAGKRSLAKGSLIIAAAGNNANRRGGDPGFVGVPANSPFIMSVGALDSSLGVANFSARTLQGRGGQVDIAGPGVNVYSSWPMPKRYNTISGTSMATPHVSGVAALLAEATGLRGRELWAELVQEAQRLEAASVDVGSGLTLAPPPADPSVPDGSAPRSYQPL